MIFKTSGCCSIGVLFSKMCAYILQMMILHVVHSATLRVQNNSTEWSLKLLIFLEMCEVFMKSHKVLFIAVFKPCNVESFKLQSCIFKQVPCQVSDFTILHP